MPIGRENYEPAYSAGIKADASKLPERAGSAPINLDTNVGRSLEALVDANGLRAVVDALAAIAYVKADHIEEAWQDRGLAQRWLAAGRRLLSAAESPALRRLDEQNFLQGHGQSA
jgi:hypothetical protein